MRVKDIYISFRDSSRLFKLAHKLYENNCKLHYKGDDNISILSSNCVGGEVYYDLGLPFNSPTINLWMTQPDFLKFAKNLDYYLNCPLLFSKELKKKYACPVAELGELEKKITLIFLHYKDQMQAEQCWEKRKRRINFDKICLMMSDRDGITYDDMVEFGKIPCYRKVMFTYKAYHEFSFAHKMEQDKKHPYVRNYQMKKWNGFWRWENQFNCAKWLNGDDDNEL